MEWSGRVDPNIGRPGFLTFYRAVQYFLDHSKLERCIENWRNVKEFRAYAEVFDGLPAEYKKERENFVVSFCQMALQQLKKHNTRYLHSDRLLRAAFADGPLGIVVASLLLTGTVAEALLQTLPEEYSSVVFPGEPINTVDYVKFLESIKELPQIRMTELVLDAQPALRFIVDSPPGALWDPNNIDAAPHRHYALGMFAAEASSAQLQERHVKRTAFIKRTGKGERTSTMMALASNGLICDTRNSSLSADDDDNASSAADEDSETNRIRKKNRRRNRVRGPAFVQYLHMAVMDRIANYTALSEEIEGFADHASNILQSLTNENNNSLADSRQDTLVASITKHIGEAIKHNTKTRKQGVTSTARARGLISISDLTKAKHMEILRHELVSRGVIPRSFLFPPKKGEGPPKEANRTHPMAPFLDQTFSWEDLDKRQSKWTTMVNMLMFDEEQHFRAENGLSDDEPILGFDTKSFRVRGENAFDVEK